MRRYKVLLFDFDYTLGDSTDGIVLCVNHALATMGLLPSGRESIRKTVGLTLAEMLGRLAGVHDGASAAMFSALFKEKADEVMTANTVLFPDTIRVLGFLKDHGAKTGIVSTKFRYRIEEILAKYGVPHLIDCIVGGEDVSNAKPDPEGLLHTMEMLGAAKADTLFIGDSVVDAGTARNAGVDFIAVTTGTTTAEAFSVYPHVRIISSLSGLIE